MTQERMRMAQLDANEKAETIARFFASKSLHAYNETRMLTYWRDVEASAGKPVNFGYIKDAFGRLSAYEAGKFYNGPLHNPMKGG